MVLLCWLGHENNFLAVLLKKKKNLLANAEMQEAGVDPWVGKIVE